MKKQLVFLALLLISNLVLSQSAKNKAIAKSNRFWNSEMIRIALPESEIGWVKFKDEINIDPLTIFLQYSKAFGLSKDDQMILDKTLTDEIGFTKYHYNQFYKNIRVEGAEYLVHTNNLGKTYSANGEIFVGIDIKSNPTINKKEAIIIAMKFANCSSYFFDSRQSEDDLKLRTGKQDTSYYPKPELIIFKLKANDSISTYALAYRIDIYGSNSQRIFINAFNGNIINSFPLEANCYTTSVNTVFNGLQSIYSSYSALSNYYYLKDDCQSATFRVRDWNSVTTTSSPIEITSTTNSWTTNNQRFGGTVLWSINRAYNYFKNIHFRNSYDGLNGNVEAYINAVFDDGFGNFYTDNASMSFSGGTMKVGLGSFGTLSNSWCPLDVICHEFTHAVTGSSAQLNYQNESGALNESFSDIFGEMATLYTLGSTDYLVAADRTSGAIRSMINPNAYGHPDTYLSTNASGPWFTGTTDYGGVHTNSGVQNFWFYLLANGGSGINDNGFSYSVSGIGATKAEKITYRNLTTYLISNSTYGDARIGSISSATDLYGAGSAEVAAVTSAWCAVGMGNTCTSCSSLNPHASNTCPVSTPITPTTSCNYASYTTCGATNSAINQCSGNQDDDVWFTFTASQSNYSINVLGSFDFDAAFQILEQDAVTGTCGGSMPQVGSCQNATGPGQLESTNISVTIGKIYYIRVWHTGVGSASTGDFQICVYNQPCTPPTTPTNLFIQSSTCNSVTLSWDASIGSGITYEVFKNNTACGFAYNSAGLSTPNTSGTISGLTPGLPYYLVVNASNSCPPSSGYSNCVPITLSTLNPPTINSATSISQFSFQANWSNTIGATSYFLDVATDNSFINYVSGYQDHPVGNNLSSVISGLNCNTNYFYRVRAFDGSCTSSNSSFSSLTTQACSTNFANLICNSGNVSSAGNFATVNVSVSNTGVADANSVEIQVSLFNDANLTSFNQNLGVQTINSIPSGFSVSSVSSQYDLCNNGPLSGVYYLGYYIDPNHLIPESSENDNGWCAFPSPVTVLNCCSQFQSPTLNSASSITQNSFLASWLSVNGATSYFIDVATDNSFSNFVTGYNNLAVGNNLSKIVSGLNCNTSYFYRVRAQNITCTSSNSLFTNLTTSPCSIPNLSCNSSSMNLSGNVLNANVTIDNNGNLLANSIEIELVLFSDAALSIPIGNVGIQTISSINAGSTASSTNSQYDLCSLSIPNGTYYLAYMIDYLNAIGESNENDNGWCPFSTPITINCCSQLAAPVTNSATMETQSSFIANWGSVSGSTGYFLDVSPNNAFSTYLNGYQNFSVGNNQAAIISGLNCNTVYFYRVRAFDGTCTSLNSNSSQALTDSCPCQTLLPASCLPQTNAYCCGIGITDFTLNTLHHHSNDGIDGYQDYTCTDSTMLIAGQTYPISITTGATYNEILKIWIDFDNNGLFDPVQELVFSDNNLLSHNGTISIPTNSVFMHPLRLRVASDYSSNPTPTPCLDLQFGQVEDYTVYINLPDSLSQAHFNATPTHLCDNGMVTFLNQTTGSPISYQWFFFGGQPATSSSVNPVVNYNSIGNYDVTLIAVYATTTDTITQNDFISVTAEPTVIISEINDTLFCSYLNANTYVWQHNQNPIDTGNINYYIPDSSGFYSVIITDSVGCSAASDSIYVFTGIETNIYNAPITIFPNPVNEILNIRCGKMTAGSYQISLSNILGQTLFDKVYKTENKSLDMQIDFKQFPSGIYFLNFSSNKITKTFKVEKQ